MNHPTQKDALEIIEKLLATGYEAYFVGGTVRDILLNRPPHDIDIVTNAPPEVTRQLFPKHSPVGAKFGVVAVIVEAGIIEVATYRTEESYTDKRRPSKVSWSNLREDVIRRDFTINGLAYQPNTKEIVDYVDGQRDLGLQLIRAIGDPKERFGEDPVRMLRAIRLKNQLGFQYDLDTYKAIKSLAPEIKHVAAERIRVELDRMLADSSRINAIKDLDELGLLEILLPEVAKLHGAPQPREYHQEGDVFAHSLLAVQTLPDSAPLFLVWATLLHDVAKPEVLSYTPREGKMSIRTPDHAKRSAKIAGEIATRLRFSREDRETIMWLIEHHMSLVNIEKMRPAKRERYLLDSRFPWLLELHRADVLGRIFRGKPKDLSIYQYDLELYSGMKKLHVESRQLPRPILNGDDLILNHLLSPGPLIQLVLDEVRDAQLHGKITTKDEALSLARTIIESHRKTG